jgi:UPF0176 protein
VYQIEGGIVRYAEKFKDQGLWEGSLYVFDKRLTLDYGNDVPVIGSCDYCASPTNSFHNCSHSYCRKRTLVCTECEAGNATIHCPDCRNAALQSEF